MAGWSGQCDGYLLWWSRLQRLEMWPQVLWLSHWGLLIWNRGRRTTLRTMISQKPHRKLRHASQILKCFHIISSGPHALQTSQASAFKLNLNLNIKWAQVGGGRQVPESPEQLAELVFFTDATQFCYPCKWESIALTIVADSVCLWDSLGKGLRAVYTIVSLFITSVNHWAS